MRIKKRGYVSAITYISGIAALCILIFGVLDLIFKFYTDVFVLCIAFIVSVLLYLHFNDVPVKEMVISDKDYDIKAYLRGKEAYIIYKHDVKPGEAPYLVIQTFQDTTETFIMHTPSRKGSGEEWLQKYKRVTEVPIEDTVADTNQKLTDIIHILSNTSQEDAANNVTRINNDLYRELMSSLNSVNDSLSQINKKS